MVKPPKHTPAHGQKHKWELSKGKYDAVKRAYKATDPDHTDSYGRIDYRWVKKSFAGHSKDDQMEFISGWWYRRKDWDQVTHMSKADKKAVEKWSKTHGGPNPKASSRVSLRKAPKPCLGRSVRAVNKPDKLYWVYLNSCDTANFIDMLDADLQVIGVVGAVTAVLSDGLSAVPAAVDAALVWVPKKMIENRKSASTLEAVIMRFSWNVGKSKYGRYYAPFWVFPQ